MSQLSNELRESYKNFAIKKGRLPNIKEKKKIRNRVKRIHNRKMFFRGVIVALGLSGLVFANKQLSTGTSIGRNAIETENQDTELNNNNKNDIIEINKEQKENFLDSLKAGAEKEINQNVNNKDNLDETLSKATAEYDYKENGEHTITNDEILDKIIKEYNEKNGTDINKYESSFMKTNTLTYIGIDRNGRYIRDYKEKTPVVDYKTDPYSIHTTIYTMVDLKNGKIIGAIGEFDDGIHDIYTNVIKNAKGREYVHADNEVNFTEIDIDKEKLGVENKPYVVYQAISEEAEKIINPTKEQER